MRERPILFSAPMVRTILAGRKTQTRRIVKPQPIEHQSFAGGAYIEHRRLGQIGISAMMAEAMPYGAVGDRLWCRETWGLHAFDDDTCWYTWSGAGKDASTLEDWAITYRADWGPCQDGCHWRPSIHMPRWASRITLEIVSVRVERLQDISEADAIAEGAQLFPDIPVGIPPHSPSRWSMESPKTTDQCLSSARYAFANYFCVVNGKGRRGVLDCAPWDANPWVWVIDFKRVTA